MDISQEEINSGWGVNEWSQADIMKLLNPDYDNNQENIHIDNETYEMRHVNNSLYWNGTSGNCYASNYGYATTTCDFSSTGMPKKLKKMIEEVTWNAGANADETFKTTESEYYYDIPTTKMYEYERSKNNGKQLCESNGDGIDCNDEEKRTSTWRGKVGLMYPSDYGYATSGGSEDSRSKCLSQSLYFWTNMYTDSFPEEIDHPNCYENNWLGGWTMTPASFDNGAYAVFVVNNGVFVSSTNMPFDIRPSVYLQSDVIVVDGNGSEDSPWILGVE